MKYGSEKNALFGGKFVWRCGMGLKVKYINAKRVCVKTKIVYHFVILNSSEGSVYIYLCLQILRFALNDSHILYLFQIEEQAYSYPYS